MAMTFGGNPTPSDVARTTEPNTFTQNQALEGTNNTAPNQTAASESSLMTRQLVALEQITPRNIILRDDFLVAAANTPATATMGELRWQIFNLGTIATSWQAGTAGSTYGVARIGTGTTTDNYTSIYVGQAGNAANRGFLNELDFIISARLAINDVTNVEFRAGIFSAGNNLFAGTFVGGAQYFRFDSATDTYWTAVSASSNSAGNIAATTVAPSDGVFYNLVFRRSGSSLYLSVDGGTEVSLSNAATPGVGCLALGVRTKENLTKSFDVDFVGFYAPTPR